MTDNSIDRERYRQQIEALYTQLQAALDTAERRYARPPTWWNRWLGIGPREPYPLMKAAWHIRVALDAIAASQWGHDRHGM